LSSSVPNTGDPNFIPIASPVDTPPEDDLRFHKRRHHRRIIGPVLPIPELTKAELEDLFLDADDYFTNPLVTRTPYENIDINLMDEIDRSINTITALQPQQSQLAKSYIGSAIPDLQHNLLLPSLLRQEVSNQTNIKFPNDPYFVPGKVVKNGDLAVDSVEIPQNANWTGGYDFLEEGRLIAFTITCNDPDIVPQIFIENSSGTQSYINNLSFRQMAHHGRGMTLHNAQSTYNTPDGIRSRDIQGTASQIFPYLARYKDQLSGSGVYDDVKNTEDDKAYVMTFEPTISLPYQRLSFQIFNGSTSGTRMINKLEIKRLVYIDPDPLPAFNLLPSDITTFNKAMLNFANNFGVNQQVMQEHINPFGVNSIGYQNPQNYSASISPSFSGAARTVVSTNPQDELYREFMEFLEYKRNKNKVQMEFDSQSMPDREQNMSDRRQESTNYLLGSGHNQRHQQDQQPPSYVSERINNPSKMMISWE
jgi:hypothetical protein